MIERISAMFDCLNGRRPALIAYATAYFPDREGSYKAILAMLDRGADAVEVGIPFSDPVLDGEVIQRTSDGALRIGASLNGVFEMVEELRGETEKPILLMTYYNPVFRYGLRAFAERANAAGVDGVVIPDLPVEEMGAWHREASRTGVGTVTFCSLTTTDDRIRKAGALATAFIYCLSRLGTTGARENVPSEVFPMVGKVRRITGKKVVVGIGISTPAQVRELSGVAHGVVIGSALMRIIIDALELGGDFLAGIRSFLEGVTSKIPLV